MACSAPPPYRLQIRDHGSALQITFPIRPHGWRGWALWLVMTAWLGMWAVAAVLVGAALLHHFRLTSWSPLGSEDLPVPFVLVWFLLWIFGGGLVAHQWLQWLLGHEEIGATPDRLTVARRPLGLVRHYRMSEVARLRVVEGDGSTFTPGWPLNRPGRIAFDYGALTIRLGASLTPAEAHHVVEAIKGRFAGYMKPALP